MSADQAPKKGCFPCKKKPPKRLVDSGKGYLDDDTLNKMMNYDGNDDNAPFDDFVDVPLSAWDTGAPPPGDMEDRTSGTGSRGAGRGGSGAGSGAASGSGAGAGRPDPRFLLSPAQGDDIPNPSAADRQKESILEWFDRSVERELQKRRDKAPSIAMDPPLAAKNKAQLNASKGATERLAEASASRIEIAARLDTDFTTELSEAVEKLAKAETMCSYAEALQAAEEAALNAPPEFAEQAAAAEARRIQTEYSKVKQTIPGIRPIEVVGYVGITKPHYAKKSR